MLWLRSCVPRKILAQQTQRTSQSHPSLRLHVRQHGLCIFETCFPIPNSKEDQVHKSTKMNRLSFFLCLLNNFLLAFLLSDSRKNILIEGQEWVNAQDCNESKKCTSPFQRTSVSFSRCLVKFWFYVGNAEPLCSQILCHNNKTMSQS